MQDRREVEFFDGVRHPKMSPRSRHSFVQAAMWQILTRCAGDRGFTGTEWRFLLSAGPKRTLFVPDVAFISAEQLRALPQEERDEPTVAPDVAVEVRSPRDDVRYLHEKIARYLAHGSAVILDILPDTRSIVAHTADATHEFSAADRFAVQSLPWLSFGVHEIFAQMDAFERL